MMTPADTDGRVGLSPQSAPEYASNSPLCYQRNQPFAEGFPAKYLPILLPRSMSRTYGFPIAQHTCIDANLTPDRSCDKQLIRATSARYRVMVTTCECLAVIDVVTCHLRSVPVITVTHAVPPVLGLSLSLSASVLPLAFVPSCSALILPFQRRMESQSDLLVPTQDPSISL